MGSFEMKAFGLSRKVKVVAAIVGLTGMLAGCQLQQPEGELQGLAGLAFSAERAMSGLEYKVLQIDGFKVPYLQGGKGEPLVLIHGYGGSKDNFTRVARYLTDTYTVYAIDVPGFGGTNRVMDANYNIPTQIDRIHQIIGKLGIERPHIGGNSMGGAIAGAYAAKYPQEVSSVWFLAPGGMKSSEQSEVRQHFLKTGEVLLIATTKEQYEKLLDLVMFKRPALAPGFVLEAMAERAAADQELHNRIFKQFRENPVYTDKLLAASDYRGPALIVWGKQDRVLHVDGAAELKAALPQAKVILMDETGHVPQMEKPEQVAKDYLGWRKSLVTATASAN